jgi:hypothetical protein
MTGTIRLAILWRTSRTERWYRWIGERFSQVGPQQRSELSLDGAWDLVKGRLMKGKASSTAGIYWPIIPKWGDRQVCLITWA